MKDIISRLFRLMPVYKKIAWPSLALSAASLLFILVSRNDVSTFPVGWEKTYFVTPYDTYVKNIRLAQKGNMIALVYEGEKHKSAGIYVSLSLDGGVNFSQPLKAAAISSKTDPGPDIAISSGGHIAVVWQELTGQDPNSRIYYSISADAGAVWTEPAAIKPRTEMELLPRVLYDDRNTLHIFYNAYKEKGFNLFHIASEDEKTFSEPESLADISAGIRGAFFPAINASGSYIYLVWQGKEKMLEALSDDLYFIKSKNYGKSWTSKKLITKSKAKDSSPFIASYNNDIFLVYQNDETKNWAIKLIKGAERGDKWEEPVAVSTTNADCYSPTIIRSEDENPFVIWYDTRNKTPGIFARKISPQNPPAPEIMLSRANVTARKPLAASTGRKIMVFWEESGRLAAKSSDISADPPIVYSPTHPENIWSKSSRAVIKWKPPADESNITGYAYLLKKPEDYNSQDMDPSIANIEGNITEVITPELEDGISYFYIRAIDGAGNYSKTVRYKIQVSKNPPAMPIVKSETHPDAKAAGSATAVLNWSMEDAGRLKGFLYSISKDAIKTPDRFTTDNGIKFDNLSQGRHFFSIRSVDKTNTLSRIATHQIIVGSASELDPEIYRKIAKDIIEEKPVIIPVKPKIPSIELSLPFDIKKAYEKSSFDAEIKTSNISVKEIIGYSYFISKEEKQPSGRINLKNNTIRVRDLKDGEYFIGVKCRHIKSAKNVWTDPVIKRFTIKISQEQPPAAAYAGQIISRIGDNYPAVSVSLIAMTLSILTIGFGAKLSFYAKLFGLRLINAFRTFIF